MKEPPDLSGTAAQPYLSFKDILAFDTSYWLVVTFGAVFTLARFSEAFLLLRASGLGVSPSGIPLIMVLMNVTYSLTAYPAGFLSDRLGRTGLLAGGLVGLILADLVLAWAENIWQVAGGVALWGLHLGLTQGLLSALVADTATPSLRGTAFGLYHLISGIALLLASLIAGGLWDRFGARAAFLAGALFATLALLLFLFSRKRFSPQNKVSVRS